MRRSTLVLSLLCLYAFLCPLGSLVRFGQQEGAFGVTTILLAVIALCCLDVSITLLKRIRMFRSLLLLIAWTLVASVFASEPVSALTNGVSLFAYLFAALAAYRYLQDERIIFYMLTCYCLGGILGATATVVDFAGVVDIAGVNEAAIGTPTELGEVMQATGPFPRRSAMAVYYTLAITLGVLLPLVYRRLSAVGKVYFGSTAAICGLALLLTHNRAGILASLISVTLVALLSARSFMRAVRVMVIVGALGAAGVYIVNVLFPEVWVAYQAVLGIGSFAANGTSVSDSDALRILFFERALLAVLSNPIGHGYSLLPNVPGYEGRLMDPHNNISQVIWASGLFGIGWLIRYGSRAFWTARQILRRGTGSEATDQMVLVLLGALIAYMLVGMVHTIISTGIAWILFGSFGSLLADRIPRQNRSTRRQLRDVADRRAPTGSEDLTADSMHSPGDAHVSQLPVSGS